MRVVRWALATLLLAAQLARAHPPPGAILVFSQRALKLPDGTRARTRFNSDGKGGELTDEKHYFARFGLLAGLLAHSQDLELYLAWPADGLGVFNATAARSGSQFPRRLVP